MSREKKVYFRVEKISGVKRRGIYEWYTIDSSNSSESESELEPSLKPVFESPPDCSYYSSGFTVWRSYIYVFGGFHEGWTKTHLPCPVSNVFYIDTRHPELGWKCGPDLLNARELAYGFVYDGKMCVLGGFPELSVYGESLQPLSSGHWLSMDMDPIIPYDRPINIDGHAIFADKLFVYGTPTTSLHSYDFKEKKWTVIEKHFKWQYQCASIDEIMYLVEGGKFMGFDLINHQWYEVVGLKEDIMLPFFVEGRRGWGFPSALVHIGNETLCLLWNPNGYIHCTKFTVCKEYDDTRQCDIIKADIKSFKVYKISDGFLEYAIAVGDDEDTGEESDHVKEEAEEDESAKDERTLPMKKNKKKKKKKKKGH